MKLREIGSSGLATAPLMLGSNVFGWTADKATSFAVLDAFVEGGGSAIDTADVYSSWVPGHVGGEAEEVIGEWLQLSKKRDKVLIATKVGMLDGPAGKGLEPAHIAAAAEASLRRLRTDRIDVYFAHQDDPSQPMAVVLEAFDKLIRAGKVRAIGASNFTPDRIQESLDTSDRNNLPRYAVVEPPYNLIDRGKFEGPLQQLCLRERLGVVPYWGLAMGFLTGKYRDVTDLDKGSRRDPRIVKLLEGKGRQVLAALDEVAAETGASVASIALAWVAAQPAVSAPIASATSVDQLRDLIASMNIELSLDQLARLDKASR